jgi:hypothetical protein
MQAEPTSRAGRCLTPLPSDSTAAGRSEITGGRMATATERDQAGHARDLAATTRDHSAQAGARLGGSPGSLARQNAMRSPARRRRRLLP